MVSDFTFLNVIYDKGTIIYTGALPIYRASKSQHDEPKTRCQWKSMYVNDLWKVQKIKVLTIGYKIAWEKGHFTSFKDRVLF